MLLPPRSGRALQKCNPRVVRLAQKITLPAAKSRGDKSSYCGQNDDLAHRVTLRGV